VFFGVFPGTWNCHQVCGELMDYCLHLLLGVVFEHVGEDGVWHLGLDAVGGHSGGHDGRIFRHVQKCKGDVSRMS
jgi:hypothetical protein